MSARVYQAVKVGVIANMLKAMLAHRLMLLTFKLMMKSAQPMPPLIIIMFVYSKRLELLYHGLKSMITFWTRF